MVERLAGSQKVGGSIPPGSTNMKKRQKLFLRLLLVIVLAPYLSTLILQSMLFAEPAYPLFTPSFLLPPAVAEVRNILLRKLYWYEFFAITGVRYSTIFNMAPLLESYKREGVSGKAVEKLEQDINKNGTCVFMGKEGGWTITAQPYTFFLMKYERFKNFGSFGLGCKDIR